MTDRRVNPFEGLEAEFPPAPGPRKPVQPALIDQVATAHNFPSRPSTNPAPNPPPPQRARYTTGRDRQLNLKASDTTIARMHQQAAARRIPLAAVLELALDALETLDARAKP